MSSLRSIAVYVLFSTCLKSMVKRFGGYTILKHSSQLVEFHIQVKKATTERLNQKSSNIKIILKCYCNKN